MLIDQRILIVDDDLAFRSRLSRSFLARGFTVQEAGSINQARMILSDFRPTHAVVDLKLESDSGLDLIDDAVRLGQCRVLMLTGYGSVATALEAVRRGAINYLTKPVGFVELQAALFGNPLERTKSDLASTDTTPTLDQIEWEYIQKVLFDCNNNITHAAKRLGMHRQALQRKLRKLPS